MPKFGLYVYLCVIIAENIIYWILKFSQVRFQNTQVIFYILHLLIDRQIMLSVCIVKSPIKSGLRYVTLINKRYLDLEVYKLQLFWQLEHKKREYP